MANAIISAKRDAIISRFLTEKTVPPVTFKNTDGTDGSRDGAVVGQQIFWQGSGLFTKPPHLAKFPDRVQVGKWDGESLYLYNTDRPLGRDTLAAARTLGIPVANIPEPATEEPDPAASAEPESPAVPEPETKSKRNK